MFEILWELPGPRRFLSQVIDEISRRRCVLVVLPRTLEPRSLRAALRATLGPDGDRWSTLAADEVLGSDAPYPVQIHEQLRLGERAPGEQVDVTDLARHDRMGDRIVWIDVTARSTDAADAPLARWYRFLEHYAEATKNLPIHRRASFVTVVRGDQPERPVVERTDLESVWWWSVIDRIDTTVYVHERTRGTDLLASRRECIVEVAAYDLNLVDHLIQAWDGDLDRLRKLLRDVASPTVTGGSDLRGAPVPGDSPPSELIGPWSDGAVERWGGRLRTHACGLNEGSPDELERCMWVGQVRVVLPEIERLRLELARWADQYRDLLDDHWQRTDVLALEIGSLKDLIDGTGPLRSDRDRAQLSRLLAASRNTLAHIQVVPEGRLRETDRLSERAGF